MDDVVNKARRLKSKAMDARDLGNYAVAVEYLEGAEKLLFDALYELKTNRENTGVPGQLEQLVVNQLIHILGSKGGVYRRAKDYKSSVDAYDAGYEFEKPDSGYGVVNSYNLTQRLITRAFIEPRSVIDGNLSVLGLAVRRELIKAREEIERQLNGKRSGDEYAAADEAFVCLLLGDENWLEQLDHFLELNPEPYAIKVTLEVLSELYEKVVASSSVPTTLIERLSEAQEELTRALTNT